MGEEKREELGGVNVEGGGDVTVGGDVAGRDVVKTITTTTIVGFSPKDVQRLIITVFGWIVVPTWLIQPWADKLNGLFGNVQLTGVAETAPHTWTVSGVAR